MKVINFPGSLAVGKCTCVALGNFDGVHKGHQSVIKRCTDIASEKGILSVVYTFKSHPLNFLGKDVKIISTNSVKKRLIEELISPDYLIFQDLSQEYLAQSPEEFVKIILKNLLNAKHVVVGEHYSFGKNGSGNASLLKEICKKFNIEVKIVPLLKENGILLSSTYIRECISIGKISEANSVLGYDFFIEGIITHGNHLGTGIGFPTVNIIPEKNQLLPEFGVYATLSEIEGVIYKGVTNIGIKPTIGAEKPVIETHLFDVNCNLYEKKVAVSFIKKLRSEQKFENLNALKQQIKTDVENAHNILK